MTPDILVFSSPFSTLGPPQEVCVIFPRYLLTLFLAAPAFAETKLLRFPDIHGDKVAFTYAGDLWTPRPPAAPRRA